MATIAFAIIFHTPQKEYVYCGITGAVGWLVYLAVTGFGGGVVAASFFATVALAWCLPDFLLLPEGPGDRVPHLRHFPIVPGAGIYYTGYHFFMRDNAMALTRAWRPSRSPSPSPWASALC